MRASSASLVTPHGVRDGDPVALAALVERRGAAVLAACEHAAGGDEPAVEHAAAAFSLFRRRVIAAADPGALDPEALLLACVRETLGADGEAAVGVERTYVAAPDGELPRTVAERLVRALLEAGAEAKAVADAPSPEAPAGPAQTDEHDAQPATEPAPTVATPTARPGLLWRVVAPALIVLAGLAFTLSRAGLFDPGRPATPGAVVSTHVTAPLPVAPPAPVLTPLPRR